jgi:hypothetical protein
MPPAARQRKPIRVSAARLLQARQRRRLFDADGFQRLRIDAERLEDRRREL